MKALGTLIKLARAEVDVVKRALAEAERMHARALSRIADLETRITDEQVVATNAPASAFSTYGAFAAARAEDRHVLMAEAAETAHHAAILRERLAEAHVELKKLEKLHELEAARAREGALRTEQAALDEAATMRAGRKGS